MIIEMFELGEIVDKKLNDLFFVSIFCVFI